MRDLGIQSRCCRPVLGLGLSGHSGANPSAARLERASPVPQRQNYNKAEIKIRRSNGPLLRPMGIGITVSRADAAFPRATPPVRHEIACRPLGNLSVICHDITAQSPA